MMHPSLGCACIRCYSRSTVHLALSSSSDILGVRGPLCRTQQDAIAVDHELMGPVLGFSVEQLMELAGLSVACALAAEYPPQLPVGEWGKGWMGRFPEGGHDLRQRSQTGGGLVPADALRRTGAGTATDPVRLHGVLGLVAAVRRFRP